MTNKQKVLARYPNAKCREVKPGHFRVFYGSWASSVGGSSSSAWKRAAQEMG